MAGFTRVLDMHRNFRLHIKNQYLATPPWMYTEVMLGLKYPARPTRGYKIPKLLSPADVIMRLVLKAHPEYNGYMWSQVAGDDKYYVHPVRRMAALVQSHIEQKGASFMLALKLAETQMEAEKQDLDMQVALAKQDAVEVGVPDAGWSGFLQRSSELYQEVARRRNAFAKQARIDKFVAICEEKLEMTVSTPLTLANFDSLYDQDEIRQAFIDYPNYRHLFPKSWYLIPSLPDRGREDGEVGEDEPWPPPYQLWDREHSNLDDAVVVSLSDNEIDQARFEIMRDFYTAAEIVVQERETAFKELDVLIRDEKDTTGALKAYTKYRKDRVNESTPTEGLLGSVEDIDVFDPTYWTAPPSSLLAPDGKIEVEKLNAKEKEEYELLTLKGRELAYDIEKNFDPRTKEFLQEHDALYGKGTEVPGLPPRMIPPKKEEEIMAFSPKYIREYFPEAFKLAVKNAKQRLGVHQQEANLGPNDKPYVGLWKLIKIREAERKGLHFDERTFTLPAWEHKINFDPEYYQALRPTLKDPPIRVEPVEPPKREDDLTDEQLEELLKD